MIRVEGLTKTFGDFKALDNVSLNVEKGDIYGFIGHNGAGKSTTISILTGLAKPDSGTCIVNGLNTAEIKSPSELSMGYLPEDPRFYKWMSARETLTYLYEAGGRKADAARINEILDWIGLRESAERRVGGFSRGMKQRLGIGAALINDPEILFLDEPSSALDPEGRGDVLRLIQDLGKMGKTVFFSTHILSDVERVCSRIGILVKGKIVKEDSLEVIKRENILPVYDIELEKQITATRADELRKLDCVKRVEILDRKIQVLTKGESEYGKILLKYFAESDSEIISFNLRKNDLEDIFLEEVKRK